ncbi:MAG: hypothetical protein PHY28_09670 [Dehalococcoidales bacterium]|nr:hypothetical protein [Dehalococcoidales bacterium]
MTWGHHFDIGFGLKTVALVVIFWGAITALTTRESKDPRSMVPVRGLTLLTQPGNAMP